MEVVVNVFAVLLAALSTMVVGSIYYANSIFGKSWRQHTGVNAKEFEKKSPKLMPKVFLAALLTAYILAHVMYMSHDFYGYSWLSTGVTSAIWLWLGISATTVYIHNTMELKSPKLTRLTIGNQFVSLLLMGLILGWLHP